MLLVPASLYVFSWVHRVAPAVVAADLMRAFSITAAALGNLAAIYPYVFAAMALVAGSLADTLGPRWTIALGGVTMGLGAALFGLAPTFGVAYAGRLLVGLGASVMLIAWLSLAAAWFRPDEFATISGWTQTVGNVGALLAASPLALLVEAVGWRETFVVIGGVTLVLAAVAAGCIRDHPGAMGLAPVNPDRAAQRAPALGEVLRGVPEVMRNPRTWPPIITAGGMYATVITFLGLWGVLYLTQVYGLARLDAATVVSMLAVGTAIGAPVVGWLSDRWLRGAVCRWRCSQRSTSRAGSRWCCRPTRACRSPGSSPSSSSWAWRRRGSCSCGAASVRSTTPHASGSRSASATCPSFSRSDFSSG